jgi:hypothetical protein
LYKVRINHVGFDGYQQITLYSEEVATEEEAKKLGVAIRKLFTSYNAYIYILHEDKWVGTIF